MREILFRGKCDTDWVYGSYNYEDKTIIDSDGHWEIDLDTVGQYTGLTDKNGKRIFEDDILKYKYATGEETICVACWVDGYAMFSNYIVKSEAKNFSNRTHFNNGEIIGNIHDNPELLEGNK